MKFFNFIFLTFILFITVTLHSEKIPIPTEYSSVFPSARIRGLGGNSSALFGDINSSFFNPAALAGLDNGGLSITFETDHYSSYSEFIEKEQSLYGKNISFFTLAAYQGGISYMPLFKITYTDSVFDSLLLERDFSVQLDQYWLSFTSYSGSDEKFETPYFLGFNFKYINGKSAETKLFFDSLKNIKSADAILSSANGFGFDAGLLINLNFFYLSLMFRDIITHVWWDSYDKMIFPVNGNLGILYKPTQNFFFNFNLSRIIKKDFPFIYTLGAEYTFLKDEKKSLTDSTSFWENLKNGYPSFRMGTSFKEFPSLNNLVLNIGAGFNSNAMRVDMAFEATLERYYLGKFDYQLTLTFPIKL